MEISDWIALAAVIVAVIALAASIGTMIYTRVQAKATKDAAEASKDAAASARISAEAAKTSADATADLTSIEADRRHTELTPEFAVRLNEGFQGVQNNGELEVRLIGPVGLDYLDEVVITIQDEASIEHWGNGLPPRVTEEEARRFV